MYSLIIVKCVRGAGMLVYDLAGLIGRVGCFSQLKKYQSYQTGRDEKALKYIKNKTEKN